jgi:predicted ArsR family transcriptional regulator
VTEGPIRAQEIASRLHLAAAGIRRHLGELERDGLIEDHEVASPRRGRGRPPRHFVATARAHDAFGSQVDGLAVEALTYVSQLGGREAVDVFAATRGLRLAERYGQTVQAAGTDVAARAQALAEAMNRDGFAATLRPGPGSLTLQLCLGHCPVHQVARAFPELCEAETQAISRLLGVHVQRLATLAGGEHVCTTCVPVALGIAEADADNEGAQ